jgi:uncharacterized membrane protein YoaK (UPF0700 family)
MTETMARRVDPPVPLLMPVLLSLVAGYLDSYTYLSLFGLFAAQVTGSFVIAGAEFVTSDFGIAGKLIAIAAFVAAAAVTAALIIAVREARYAALPWMLALETLLLAGFAAIMVFGPAVSDARDGHGILAGVFAAMAMGAQKRPGADVNERHSADQCDDRQYDSARYRNDRTDRGAPAFRSQSPWRDRGARFRSRA